MMGLTNKQAVIQSCWYIRLYLRCNPVLSAFPRGTLSELCYDIIVYFGGENSAIFLVGTLGPGFVLTRHDT